MVVIKNAEAKIEIITCLKLIGFFLHFFPPVAFPQKIKKKKKNNMMALS